jgi:hypothetical protein
MAFGLALALGGVELQWIVSSKGPTEPVATKLRNSSSDHPATSRQRQPSWVNRRGTLSPATVVVEGAALVLFVQGFHRLARRGGRIL